MFFRDLIRSKKSPHPHIIIYGNHSADWMEALSPPASVWKKIFRNQTPSVELITEGAVSSILAAKRDIVVIPLMEDHIVTCLGKCPEQYSRLLPHKEAVDVFRDKAAFAAYVAANNLSQLCPRTFTSPENAEFPCVLKRTDLNSGRGVAITMSLSQLKELLLEETWREQPFVLQELIATQTDYVAHCVCEDGRVLWHCAYAYDLGGINVIRGAGHPSKITSLRKSQLKAIEQLLLPIKYSGPCNVDFKILPNGQIKILEINPRLGGSLMRRENLKDLHSTLACIIKTARPSKVGSL